MDLESMRWSLAQGEHDKTQVWIRFRQFPSTFPCATFEVRLNIFWTMHETNSKGLATPAEDERMGEFEDHVIDAVEGDMQAVLAMVVTAKGTREWIFHTKDADAFLARVEAIPTEGEPFPIKLQRYDDPEWGYDLAFLQDTKVTAPRGTGSEIEPKKSRFGVKFSFRLFKSGCGAR